MTARSRSRRATPKRRAGGRGAGKAAGRAAGRTAQSFYASALDEAERSELEQAREVVGLDDEIALLRLRLRDVLAERGPEDQKLLHNGVRLLVQALLARHRLSPKQADNLSEAMTNVLEEFGEVLREAGDE